MIWLKYPTLNFGKENPFQDILLVGFEEESYKILRFSNGRSMWQIKHFLSLCYLLFTNFIYLLYDAFLNLILNNLIISLTGFYVLNFSKGYSVYQVYLLDLLFFKGRWLSFQIKLISWKIPGPRPNCFWNFL